MPKTKENNDTNLEIQDYIGRQEFVDKIISTINFANDKKSWTFAIDGAWGSGKSFVLKMIEKELKDNQDYLIVKYDAWKNDFYNEPLIAILYNVVDALVKTQTLKQVKEEIVKTIRVLSATLNFIPYAKQIKKDIKSIKDTIKNAKETNKLEIAKNFISYNDTLKQIQEQLIKISKKKKVVIMVDELDRCEPDYSLNVLNRLHNLFDIPNCVVLLAVNKCLLNSVIHNKYGKDNIRYLDKFFDLTFTLPVNGNKDIRLKYEESFLLEFIPNEKLDNCGLFKSIIIDYMPKEARYVVKFFEKLRFIINNYDTIEDKYDFSCLATFLLLNMDKKENYINFLHRHQDISLHNIIDTNNQNINIQEYFSKGLAGYIQKGKTQCIENNNLKYLDGNVRRFLALFNMVVFWKVEHNFGIIDSYFGLGLCEDKKNKVKELLNIIEILK